MNTKHKFPQEIRPERDGLPLLQGWRKDEGYAFQPSAGGNCAGEMTALFYLSTGRRRALQRRSCFNNTLHTFLRKIPFALRAHFTHAFQTWTLPFKELLLHATKAPAVPADYLQFSLAQQWPCFDTFPFRDLSESLFCPNLGFTTSTHFGSAQVIQE